MYYDDDDKTTHYFETTTERIERNTTVKVLANAYIVDEEDYDDSLEIIEINDGRKLKVQRDDYH